LTYQSCASNGGKIGRLIKNSTCSSVPRTDTRHINFFAHSSYLAKKKSWSEELTTVPYFPAVRILDTLSALKVGYCLSSFVAEA